MHFQINIRDKLRALSGTNLCITVNPMLILTGNVYNIIFIKLLHIAISHFVFFHCGQYISNISTYM